MIAKNGFELMNMIPVAVIILKKKHNHTNVEDFYSGERHDIESFRLDEAYRSKRRPPDIELRSPVLDLPVKKKAVQKLTEEANNSSDNVKNYTTPNNENVEKRVIQKSLEQTRETKYISGNRESQEEEEVKVYVVDEQTNLTSLENSDYDSNSNHLSSPSHERHCQASDVQHATNEKQSPEHSSSRSDHIKYDSQTSHTQQFSKPQENSLSQPIVLLSPVDKKLKQKAENLYYYPSFEKKCKSFWTQEEGGGGPNKAAEEISRLVEIDRKERAALTAEIKERYERIEVDGNKKYICKICQKSFERWCNLNAHVTMHLDIKPYVCKICAVRYKLRSILNDHIRAAHLKKDFYRCKVCKLNFKHRSNLKQHLKKHEST